MDKNGNLHARLVKNQLTRGRLLLVIPAKAVKKATQRNKIRRRTREILRKNSIKIKDGYDLMIIFRKGAEGLDFKALENEILNSIN